jgi:hypothetical protein
MVPHHFDTDGAPHGSAPPSCIPHPSGRPHHAAIADRSRDRPLETSEEVLAGKTRRGAHEELHPVGRHAGPLHVPVRVHAVELNRLLAESPERGYLKHAAAAVGCPDDVVPFDRRCFC